MYLAYFFTKSKEPKRKPSTWLTFSKRVETEKEAKYLAYFCTKSKGPKRKPSTWLTFSQRVRNRKGSQVLGLLLHKE